MSRKRFVYSIATTVMMNCTPHPPPHPQLRPDKLCSEYIQRHTLINLDFDWTVFVSFGYCVYPTIGSEVYLWEIR